MENLICQQCGKAFSIPSCWIKRGAGKFCSKECYNIYRAKIACTCLQCSKVFYLKASQINDGRGKFCSQKCYNLNRQAIMAEKICPVCGRVFEIKKSIADRFIVCSRKCRLNKPTHIIKNCVLCGKPFKVYNTETARGNYRSHCSFRCYRLDHGENHLEQIVRQALERLQISFIQEHQIGRYSIDFAIPDRKLAIEVDGDYWHRNPKKEKRRDSFLNKYGWIVIHLPEHQLKQTKDIDQFILDKINL